LDRATIYERLPEITEVPEEAFVPLFEREKAALQGLEP
jgi:hypothetical protein